MNLRRAKIEIEEISVKKEFSQFTLALVRHTLRPSSQSLSYYPYPNYINLYPKDHTLHTNQTTLDNFPETPVRHMSSKKPSPHSSEHVLAMCRLPVPKYDHDDPMGLIKHLRVLDITAGRPDPFPTPPPPSALAMAPARWEARASAAASASSRATTPLSVRGRTGPRTRSSASSIGSLRSRSGWRR